MPLIRPSGTFSPHAGRRDMPHHPVSICGRNRPAFAPSLGLHALRIYGPPHVLHLMGYHDQLCQNRFRNADCRSHRA